MSRTSVNRTAIYSVTVPADWAPYGPWSIPPSFIDGVLTHRNLHLVEARDFVRIVNRESLQVRSKDVDAWDRKWSVCVPCVKIPCHGQKGVQS